MDISINYYINFQKLFIDLYEKSEFFLKEEKEQVKHYNDIINFKEEFNSAFEINLEESIYCGDEIVFVFSCNFDESNESCNYISTADYIITYDIKLDEFIGCEYEQG